MLNAAHTQLIAQTPLFAGLDEAIVRRAAELAHVRAYAPGETVFTEGGAARGLGILLEGRAQVHKAAGGSRVLMSVLEPPAMTGASCLFLPDASAVTEVLAIKACKLAVFEEAVLRSIMRESFELAENYMRCLTGRIRFLTGRIESIATPGAAEKLMNHLALNAREGKLTLPLGYTALADALCVSRATLYRVLDVLEAEGRLHRNGKTIYITEDIIP